MPEEQGFQNIFLEENNGTRRKRDSLEAEALDRLLHTPVLEPHQRLFNVTHGSASQARIPNNTRDRRGILKEGLEVVKDIVGMGGSIKDFIFNLAGPVLKKLKVEGNKEAYIGMANKLLPYTGLQGHAVAQNVRALLDNGEVQNAIDHVQRHRIRYKPQCFWANEPVVHEEEGTIIASQDMDSQEVYKSCRKVVPFVDNVLTKRLKSQSFVNSSLTQALFDDLKVSISKDLADANERLYGLIAKAETLEALLGEALKDHHLDRVTLYVCCFLTLFVCFISVTVVGLMWYSILSKVNQLINLMSNQSNRVGEREALNPNFRPNQGISISTPLNTTSFSFAKRMEPPSGLKALPPLH